MRDEKSVGGDFQLDKEGRHENRKERWIRNLLTLISGLLVAAILVFLYSPKDHSAEGAETKRKIGAVYMTMNNPFFEILSSEIQSVTEENGDLLIVRNPALNVEKQIEQIYELLELGVEALIVNPVDFIEIKPALEEAKKRNVIVIVVDTNVYDQELADCTVVSDNYAAGTLCGNYLISQRSGARIVLLEHSKAKSAVDRMQGFEDILDGNEKYEIVGRAECAGQLELAMPAVQKLIETGVLFDTIFALNDPAALGAMAALKEAGMLEGVSVYAVDGAPEAKALIKEGYMTATAAQFPVEIGRIAAENMYLKLNGQDCPTEVLVPVSLITKDNINEFEIDRWQ